MAGQTTPLNPQTPPSTSTAPSVRAFVSHMSETTKTAVAQQRPWTQLLDRSAIRRPESLSDASSRVKKNLSYFRMNYAMFMLVVVGISLLWHPVALIVLSILVAAWMFLYFFRTEPFVIFNRSFGDKEVLVVLGIGTIIALVLTKVGTTLATALAIGAAIILLHAVFRAPDDLFLDEQENAAGGYLTFTGNGTAPTAGGRV